MKRLAKKSAAVCCVLAATTRQDVTATTPAARTDPPAPTPAPKDVDPARHALFLDVDGTLLDLAERPDAVVVPDGLIETLAALHQRYDGAVALLSGRALTMLDARFAPLRLPGAGLHGLEVRFADAGILRYPVDRAGLARLRAAGAAIEREQPGLLIEDKGASLALHYRLAPALANYARRKAAALVAQLGPRFMLQPGDHVVEIRPAGMDKGRALAALMAAPPFHGRRPIAVGDDYTDEYAIEAAQRLGGCGVVVGARRPTSARYALIDPSDVRRWLHGLSLSLRSAIA